MLSIIIVHWNTPELLSGCLASIDREREGSGETTEVIVVDCRSRDDAHQAIVGRHASALLVQMKENLGYSAGCNSGAAAARGELLLFLNADTVLQPGSLAELTRTFMLAPHVGMVAPLLLNVDGSVQSAGYRFPGIANVLCDLLPVPARVYGSSLNGRFGPGDGVYPYAVDYALGAALALRREAFDAAGGFDASYGMYSEEIELARRLAACGWTRLIAPAARVTHIGGASTGQMPAKMQAALWRSRGRYVRRWESPSRQRAIATAVSLACAVRSRLGSTTDASRFRAIRQAFEDGLRCRD